MEKLHNEELNDLYSSPNMVWVIDSRRMRLVRHIARGGREEAYTGLLWGNLMERNHFEYPDVNGMIIRGQFNN
jgi:hypothetical protein